MADTYRKGAGTIEVDQADLLATLDKVSDGAAGRFVARTSTALEEIRQGAVGRWPVKTGKSRDAFRLASAITPTAAEVRIDNAANSNGWPYAVRMKYSVRTEESLDREAEAAGRRGRTPATKIERRDNWRRLLTRRHGLGAPSEALAGKSPWWAWIRRPGREALKELLPELRDDLAKLAQGD